MKTRINPKIQTSQWMTDARNSLLEKPYEPVSTLWALLSFFTGKSHSWLVAHPEFPISFRKAQKLNHALERIKEGYPLAYIIGKQSFYDLDFYIDASVLIPRPETELMVETALNWLLQHPRQRNAAEIGIGSGCISISLAYHIKNLSITATDISWSALQIAKRNIAYHKLTNRICLIQSDLLSCDNFKFDLICANLPYVPRDELSFLEVSRYEPHIALDGGNDGLFFIRQLLENSINWLATNGVLLLEIESRQENSILSLASSIFPHRNIQVFCDLAKLPRLLMIENSKNEF